MKNKCLLLLSLSIAFFSAQNIEFSDPNFKSKLLNYIAWNSYTADGTICYNEFWEEIQLDANFDNEVSFEEAAQVYAMTTYFNGNIWDYSGQHEHYFIDGLENFVNLNYFSFHAQNEIQNITFNIEEVGNVKGLVLHNIKMHNTSFDFTNFDQLEKLYLTGEYDSIVDINLLNNFELKELSLDSISILSELNIGNSLFLEKLFIAKCENLNSLILPISSDLIEIRIYDTKIDSIDFSNLSNLENLTFINFSPILQSIDLSFNSQLNYLAIYSLNLESINLKNGSIFNDIYQEDIKLATGKDSLNICVDEHNLVFDMFDIVKYNPDNPNDTIVANITINDFCSDTSGDNYSTISGTSKFDINANGYDEVDISIPFQKLNLTVDSNNYTYYSNQNGGYQINIGDSYSNSSVVPEPNANLFAGISPNQYSSALPLASPVIQNFSFSPTSDYSDLEIYSNSNFIVPGNSSNFILYVQNNGNVVENVTVNWQFPSNYMQINSINETPMSTTMNSYTWYFSNLNPLETKEIEINATFNTPTNIDFPLNAGDLLTFTSTVSISNSDENLGDNEFIENVTVVNSYDPNDKTCLNGDTLANIEIGNYLYYKIRFDNLGTANAQTVTVVDSIDVSKFDISTLKPLEGSHNFQTKIKNNVAKFTFDNINLPFDDANNDGFVIFKIKTLQSVPTESLVDNQANIYFDYNYPVTTNNEETLFTDNLGVEDVQGITEIRIIPNPVKIYFKINAEIEVSSIEIYDVNGRLIQKLSANSSNTFNVENLPKGIYNIKINTIDNQQFVSKFIKQ